MKRILLTGATGFIGSQVARELLRAGTEVIAAVRPNADFWRLEPILGDLKRIECDVFDRASLQRLSGVEVDLCVHLAWYAVPGKYPSALENLSCIQGTLDLAQTLAQSGCSRFVGTGTCFEYDFDRGYLSEETPTHPKSLYAASKIATQTTLELLARQLEMSFVWVRPFYQYGPFEDLKRLVPSLIVSLLQGKKADMTRGEQIRDFLHVEDVASAIALAALSDLEGPVNVGSGVPVSVAQIARVIGKILDRSELLNIGGIPYNPNDPMFICANNRKLKSGTSWSPRYDLESGLEQTISWWKARLAAQA